MSDRSELLAGRLRGALAAVSSLSERLADIDALCGAVLEILERGGTLFTAGNGGSAAQAMHLSEELIGRYRSSRPPHRAVCLNADGAALTCIANDFGYEEVFARQCRALIGERDGLLVLSTSGRSANLVTALQAARERRGVTLGLLGRDGGDCAALCDRAVIVPGPDSAHIQEAHQVVVHLICEVVEATGPEGTDAEGPFKRGTEARRHEGGQR